MGMADIAAMMFSSSRARLANISVNFYHVKGLHLLIEGHVTTRAAISARPALGTAAIITSVAAARIAASPDAWRTIIGAPSYATVLTNSRSYSLT